MGISAMVVAACALPAQAQEDKAAALAKQLSNPVASLISVPLQYNYDTYGGANDDAAVHLLNLQPVVPFSLSTNWNLVTRTIIPLKDQVDFPVDAMNGSGLGDIIATQYFSPKSPTSGGVIWGVGPAELLPTATEDSLGGEKWGLGPTVVALKQAGPWTLGFLGSHIWSVAGDDERADVNLTSLQPFASYLTRTHTTFAALTETAYDWEGDQWSVPVIVMAAQMLKIGPQILQVAVGGKYWADAPDGGPDGWGLRGQVTLVFPK